MGLFRAYLAASILISHAGGFSWLNPNIADIAVQAFFSLSGFYMALILTEKYGFTKAGAWSFYQSRFFRLFPVYYLLGAIVLFASNRPEFGSIFEYPLWAQAFILFSNISLLGQDLFLFFKTAASGHGLTFAFTPNHGVEAAPAYTFLLIRTAWSLSTEIYFYLLAPFLLKRSTKLLLSLIALSIAVRIVIYQLGYYHDPWMNRFFPAELMWFLIGSLAYRYRQELSIHNTLAKRFSRQFLSIGAYILLTVLCFILPKYFRLIDPYGYLTILMFSLTFPTLFHLFGKNRSDAWIGDLTYVLYLGHPIVISVLLRLGLHGPLVALIGTLLLAITLSPLEIRLSNWRHEKFIRQGFAAS